MTDKIKGPWKQARVNGSRGIINVDNKTIMCDEQYYPWTPDSDEEWSLITAAPIMYEALLKLSKGNRSPGVLEIARTAIKDIKV
jgi:hypothetical protein